MTIKRADVPAEAAGATHRHFKGGWYRVVVERARCVYTDAELVVYLHLYPGERRYYARHFDEFHDRTSDGRLRFEPVEE